MIDICHNKGSEFYQKIGSRLTDRGLVGAVSGRRDRIVCGNAREVITDPLTTIPAWQLTRLYIFTAGKFLVNRWVELVGGLGVNGTRKKNQDLVYKESPCHQVGKTIIGILIQNLCKLWFWYVPMQTKSLFQNVWYCDPETNCSTCHDKSQNNQSLCGISFDLIIFDINVHHVYVQ